MYSISFQDDISIMPRERLMREGAEKLSNQELLSIFLRTGNKKETVFQVSFLLPVLRKIDRSS